MVNLSLQVSGIERAIMDVTRMMNRTERKLRTLCEKLAEIGVGEMNVRYQTAIYDGTPDIQIGMPVWVDDYVLEIPVTGSTVAFIEFGTGVYYPDDHPAASTVTPPAIRGEYGSGRGKGRIWKYYGDPGTFGWYYSDAERAKGLVTTRGNPANAVMYDAAKEMRNRISDIARSVFAND